MPECARSPIEETFAFAEKAGAEQNAADDPACSGLRSHRFRRDHGASSGDRALLCVLAFARVLCEGRGEGHRAGACSLLQDRRSETCGRGAGVAALLRRLRHRSPRSLSAVEPPCPPGGGPAHAGAQADPGNHAARAALAFADLDRPIPRNKSASTASSGRCRNRSSSDVGLSLCKEGPVKPVLLLPLLACASALGCVALPPPLPPADDPANDKAAEAPWSPPAQPSAGPASAADAGMATEPPQHHHMHSGSDGGKP